MASVIEDVSRGALAFVGGLSVYADSVQADIGTKFIALVDVLAHVVLCVEPRAAWTNALEATGCVSTLSTAAQRLLQFAFVYITANLSSGVHFVATIANATIGSHEVLAAAIYANVGILRALVDVISIVGHSSAMWTQCLEFVRSWKWTSLTGTSPAHRLSQNYGAATTT